MPSAFKNFSRRFLISGALASVCAVAGLAQVDPPSRVARLNYLSGNVSMKPAEAADWFGAELNRPFSTGDSLYTDTDGRAELHVDVAAIRMGSRTSFGFAALTDQGIQIQLSDGDLHLRVHNLGPSESIEVDTPNAAVTLLRDGIYRFRVDSVGGVSFLVVRQGTAEVNAGGQAATVNPGNSVLVSGGDRPAYDLEQAPGEDDFDMWCRQRDDHEAHLASARYVPATLIGYEDLDDNGSWEPAPQYGAIWYPRAVPIGWAPYRFGHWVWVAPWGWTWVDDARWGFAPFHYGRWVFLNSRWGWCPGPVVVVANAPPMRPRYAPALVAWVGGGSHWGVGISVGGPPTAWVALGFGELYTPPYHCSPHYFNNVNVSNTRVVNNVNITNVYQTVYVNKTVYNQTFVHMNSPNAVVAVSASAMASGRPVNQQAIALRREDIQQMQPAAAPQVAHNVPMARPATPVPHPQQQPVRFAQVNHPVPGAQTNQPAPFMQRPPQASTPSAPFAQRPTPNTPAPAAANQGQPAPFAQHQPNPPTNSPAPAAVVRQAQPAPPNQMERPHTAGQLIPTAPPAKPIVHEYPHAAAERVQPPAEHHDAPKKPAEKHEKHEEHKPEK
jgi:hypothetical protein